MLLLLETMTSLLLCSRSFSLCCRCRISHLTVAALLLLLKTTNSLLLFGCSYSHCRCCCLLLFTVKVLLLLLRSTTLSSYCLVTVALILAFLCLTMFQHPNITSLSLILSQNLLLLPFLETYPFSETLPLEQFCCNLLRFWLVFHHCSRLIIRVY